VPAKALSGKRGPTLSGFFRARNHAMGVFSASRLAIDRASPSAGTRSVGDNGVWVNFVKRRFMAKDGSDAFFDSTRMREYFPA